MRILRQSLIGLLSLVAVVVVAEATRSLSVFVTTALAAEVADTIADRSQRG